MSSSNHDDDDDDDDEPIFDASFGAFGTYIQIVTMTHNVVSHVTQWLSVKLLWICCTTFNL